MLIVNYHTTINYDPNFTPKELAQKIVDATKNSYIVHIKGIPYEGPSLHDYYDEVTNYIGHCLHIGETEGSESVEGKWTYVCYDPTIQNAYRSSRNAQPLHTDGSYQKESPDATCMYCISTAHEGGETVFISGERLIELLQMDRPDLYDQLCKTPVCFSRQFSNGENGKTRKIIEQDAQGNILLTWNYYRVEPDSPPHVKKMCDDFHNYLQKNIMHSDNLFQIKLLPGEAVLWLDEKILHGRNAFVAHEYGQRNLAKTCIKLTQEA